MHIGKSNMQPRGDVLSRIQNEIQTLGELRGIHQFPPVDSAQVCRTVLDAAVDLEEEQRFARVEVDARSGLRLAWHCFDC